jgi:hypothetical protein
VYYCNILLPPLPVTFANVTLDFALHAQHANAGIAVVLGAGNALGGALHSCMVTMQGCIALLVAVHEYAAALFMS